MAREYKRFRGLSDGLARDLDLLIAHEAASKDEAGKPTIAARITRANGSVYEVRVTQLKASSQAEDKVESGLQARQREILEEARKKTKKSADEDDDDAPEKKSGRKAA